MTSNHDSQQLPRIPSTVLAAIGILVTGFLLRRAQKKGRRSQRVAPGPPAHAGLRLLLPGGPERITMFRRLQRRYGDMVRFTIAGRVVHLVSDPEGAKHVLQDNNRNYVKGRGLEKTRDLLGEGLLTSEGEYWRRQRRLIQPIFHRRKIATFGSKMTAATEAMLARWQPRANTGEPFDVSEEMMRLTLDIVSKTLFSTALNEAEFETVAEVMRPMLRFATRRITSPFDFMDDWPTPANLRNRQRQEKLNQIVYRIIRERRSSNQTHDDLLGMLMGARDEETGAGMDDRQLRDEVMTIFLAGHETTANLLSFLWALLAEYAAVRRQLQQELDQQLRGRAPTVDDIPALTLTNLVIQETLRLYPPAWIIGRQSVEADNIAGYTIPPHTGVLISPYIIHRHTGYWRNPEGFDPWRFTEERSQDRPRYAFLPFGGGPRLCIGNNFALTEAALVVATIAQRYDLDLAPDRHAEVEAAFTLRPKNGVWMTLHERKNHRSGA